MSARNHASTMGPDGRGSERTSQRVAPALAHDREVSRAGRTLRVIRGSANRKKLAAALEVVPQTVSVMTGGLASTALSRASEEVLRLERAGIAAAEHYAAHLLTTRSVALFEGLSDDELRAMIDVEHQRETDAQGALDALQVADLRRDYVCAETLLAYARREAAALLRLVALWEVRLSRAGWEASA